MIIMVVDKEGGMGLQVTPEFGLSGRVVLVTGASRGIGKACALAAAGSGADIVLGLRAPEASRDLVNDVVAMGRKAIALPMDLADLAGVRASIAEAQRVFGRIDILVNNVGIGPENLAENVREEDFDLTLNVNLKGTFFTTQAVAKGMMARKWGRIVNISSQAGSVVLRGESIYCMSKAAINHLTRCLAHEWAAHGITVNSVSPTFIHTDGTEPALSDPQFRQYVVNHIPLGRIGEPIDVAGAVVFLASPAASLITGANLLVDGGWSVA
jgi:NAD(P)-dependent dehydrogenase (short-subunit alcohol dehydrogenase family)